MNKNGSKKKILRLIHIIGLPGAGKTTLSNRLKKHLRLKGFTIGEFRARFPKTPEGEADAWIKLYTALSRKRWHNCILETTGLNSREGFLRDAFPFGKIITIKLLAPRNALYARIRLKKPSERGGQWLFSESLPDKFAFVRELFDAFKQIPAEICIQTGRMTKEQVFRKVLSELKRWEA